MVDDGWGNGLAENFAVLAAGDLVGNVSASYSKLWCSILSN